MSLSSMLNPDESASPPPPSPANIQPNQSQIGEFVFDSLFIGESLNFDFDVPSFPQSANSLRHYYDSKDGWEGPESNEYDDTDPSDVERISGTSIDDQNEEVDIEADADAPGIDKVCYGMLYRQDVKLVSQNMESLVINLKTLAGANNGHVQKFKLTPKPVHILLSLPDKTEFGLLRDNMTKALEPLLKETPSIEIEAVGVTSALCEQIGRASKPEEALVQVNVNIYGPRERAAEIGGALSDQKHYLQRPDYFKAQFPYDNPHTLIFPDLEGQLVEEEVREEVSAAAKPRAEEDRLKTLVTEVHNSLSRAKELEIEIGDKRLKSDLLNHQQRALSYMLQRESGAIPEKYRLWQKGSHGGQELYIHRITKTRSQVRPEEMGGGVLADEMGMGKTFSTLALIVQTIEAGLEWAEQKRSEEHTSGKARRYSHATLIVVPSALLINTWLNEIELHIQDGLKTVKYHGQGREKDLSELEQADVVITTYNTLASEFSPRKAVLDRINWYRIVLDEAHIIRRPTTTFYRTCTDLEARSRWCLTGTPIQNRLEDIGALFAFLRAEPFHSLAQFRRFICIPFEQGDAKARDRLVLLYDALCLRRTKDILELPSHNERTRDLTMTDDERRQYDKTFKILLRYMGTGVSQYPGGAGHGHDHRSIKFGQFQAHLQLRILCNHGTFQKPFSWKKRDLKDERAAEREAFIGLGQGPEIMCDGCKQPRPILGSTNNSFVENCTHSFCLECLDDCADFPGMQNMKHCPLCHRFGNAPPDDQDDIVMQDGDDEDNTPDKDMVQENSLHKDYFNRTGFSTKMNALIRDVKEDVGTTKSIIFSCWTKTLNLISRQLTKEKIRHLRIDGDCLLSKRQNIIDKFARDGNARVLLMTTGTGAFGLNLTAANRIFLVEPQWNPSVENQAIARAIRLRQQKEVLVTRYYLRDTVEESMRSQQVKKRQVALFGFAREDGEVTVA